MNDPIATFPNETYLNGLRVADAVVVDALYNEFRQPIAKAVESAGLSGGIESEADTLTGIIQEMLLTRTSERQGSASHH